LDYLLQRDLYIMDYLRSNYVQIFFSISVKLLWHCCHLAQLGLVDGSGWVMFMIYHVHSDRDGISYQFSQCLILHDHAWVCMCCFASANVNYFSMASPSWFWFIVHFFAIFYSILFYFIYLFINFQHSLCVHTSGGNRRR
jgi:hypothetical protein